MKQLVRRGNNLLTPGQNVLWNKRGELDVQSRQDIAAGEPVFKDGVIYLRENIKDHNKIVEYFQEDVDKKVGKVNLSGGVIPKGYNYAIERIWLGYATDPAQDDPTQINTYSNVAASVHPNLRNAEIKFSSNGKALMPALPVSNFLVAAEQEMHIKEAGMMLDNIWLLKAGESVQVTIEYPDAIPDTEEHHIEIVLSGALLS